MLRWGIQSDLGQAGETLNFDTHFLVKAADLGGDLDDLRVEFSSREGLLCASLEDELQLLEASASWWNRQQSTNLKGKQTAKHKLKGETEKHRLKGETVNHKLKGETDTETAKRKLKGETDSKAQA